MLRMISFNRLALIAFSTICAYSALQAQESRDSNAISRSDDRDSYQDRSTYRDSYQNNSRAYDDARDRGYYDGYANYGGYAAPAVAPAPVVYPQYQYGVPSNRQTFPNEAEFNSTYERNAHPPR